MISKINIDRAALKESLTDTILATPLSLALNFVLISFCYWMGWGPISTTLFITSVMFVFAVIRKYLVRLHFRKKEDETRLAKTIEESV